MPLLISRKAKSNPAMILSNTRRGSIAITSVTRNQLGNGLLLRTDVHRLFDKGYVTVAPDGRFLVSRRLKDDFDNGEPYMPFHEQSIWTPRDPRSQPHREALEWHTDTAFLG